MAARLAAVLVLSTLAWDVAALLGQRAVTVALPVRRGLALLPKPRGVEAKDLELFTVAAKKRVVILGV